MKNQQKSEEDGLQGVAPASAGTLESEICALLGDMELQDNGFAVKIRFSAGFCGFRGHFPGNPVLPGVAQIMLLRCLLEKGLGGRVSVTGVSQAKFLLPVGPDTDILACMEQDAKKEGRWKGFVETDAGIAARVVLETEEVHAR